jgi:hypothetical protein
LACNIQKRLITKASSVELMFQSTIEKELRLIWQRLEAIEEALAEEMSEEDKRDLKEALTERKKGRSVPLNKVRASFESFPV